MSSETDASASDSSPHPQIGGLRLGLCEVCAAVQAKYTCPKCEVKTCCLRCLHIHKKELDCSGIRDKTRFIPLRDMTHLDFVSDYTFLEEATRYVADRKRDQLKRHTRFNKTLPAHLFKLRAAAGERGTQLRFLLALFSRHAANTTFYEWKTRVLWWRVEWVFVHAGALRCADERCDERALLRDLLRRYVEVQAEEDEQQAGGQVEEAAPPAAVVVDSDGGDKKPVGPSTTAPLTDGVRKALQFYRARGLGSVRVLLKAEGIKRSAERYWELDPGRTLRANLSGKTLVEFPVVYVVFDEVVREFDVIDSDEDVARETELHQMELRTTTGHGGDRAKRHHDEAKCNSANQVVANIGSDMRELQLQRRRRSEERRARRARLAKRGPQNLLLANENGDGDEESTDDDDSDGNETEEEEETTKQVQQSNTKEAAAAVDEDDLEFELATSTEAKRAKLE